MRERFNIKGVSKIEDIKEVKEVYQVKCQWFICLLSHEFIEGRLKAASFEEDSSFTYIDTMNLLHDLFLPAALALEDNYDLELIQ